MTPYLVLYVRPNGQRRNRLGVTVSTKLGGAVVRNRARRRLREVFRLAQPDLRTGYDVILVARGRTVNGPYQKLTAAFYKGCGQLGLLKRRTSRDPAAFAGRYPILSEADLAGAAAPVPFYPYLLPIRPGGHREVWPGQRGLAGFEAVPAVPSLSPPEIPSSMTRSLSG